PQKQGWLNLEQLAQVRLSSENTQFPIESALLPGEGTGAGWRSAAPGAQTISIHFYVPQSIRRVYLIFVEEQQERVQEFVLRWNPQGADRWVDIVRQQFVFSPPGTTREVEEY